MANRRNLKKTINYITGELFAECVVHRLYIPGTDPAKTDELMQKILVMQDDFIRRTNHTEPGNVKGFYKKLLEEFDDQVNQIIDEIGQLN